MSERCDDCGGELVRGGWPWCHGDPEVHKQPVRFNWHFKQGQNDARREQFFKERAEDPFNLDGGKDDE